MGPQIVKQANKQSDTNTSSTNPLQVETTMKNLEIGGGEIVDNFFVTKFIESETKENETYDANDDLTDVGIGHPSESIAKWLERPIRILTKTWSSSDTGRLAVLSLPAQLFSVLSVKEKLQNWTFLRAGVKIRFMINGTIFHYGKLRMTWFPNAGPTDFESQVFPTRALRSTRIAQTGLPGVDIYPDGSNTYEMDCSWDMPLNTINLPNTFARYEVGSNIGTIAVWVINPLRSLQDVTVPISFSIYASFTDVKLTGPRTPYSVNLSIPNGMAFEQGQSELFFPIIPLAMQLRYLWFIKVSI